MPRSSAILAAASLIVLSACSDGADVPAGNSAEDFAARINGGQAGSAQGTVAPSVAEPLPGAAPGPYTPGTHTDPTVACGANVMGPYLGKSADEATRREIVDVIGGTNAVRFVMPGGAYIEPDPFSERLNLMLDAQGIIRDARCG